MAENSGISWTTHTANFWHGCVKVSALCDNCYAERDTTRYGRDFIKDRFFVKDIWSKIPKWEQRAQETGFHPRVFVMSMGDFFERLPVGHKDADQMHETRLKAMQLMKSTTHLRYLLLTKRISNVGKMVPPAWMDAWPQHIRLGISVGTQPDADRDIPRLLEIPAPNFVSMEPLLERVSIAQWRKRLEWVITGGESGPQARPADPDWFRQLRDECAASDVPFHFKQWGEWAPWSEAPPMLNPSKVRETQYPSQSVFWIGKQKSGHRLDGVEHFAFPR